MTTNIENFISPRLMEIMNIRKVKLVHLIGVNIEKDPLVGTVPDRSLNDKSL